MYLRQESFSIARPTMDRFAICAVNVSAVSEACQSQRNNPEKQYTYPRCMLSIFSAILFLGHRAYELIKLNVVFDNMSRVYCRGF